MMFPTQDEMLQTNDSEVVAIAFGHLYILYFLLIVGYLFSLLVMVVEIVFNRFTQICVINDDKMWATKDSVIISNSYFN